MEKVIEILMERDGIDYEEAKELVHNCREALLNGEEEAIYLMLGLEDDYIFDILEG